MLLEWRVTHGSRPVILAHNAEKDFLLLLDKIESLLEIIIFLFCFIIQLFNIFVLNKKLEGRMDTFSVSSMFSSSSLVLLSMSSWNCIFFFWRHFMALILFWFNLWFLRVSKLITYDIILRENLPSSRSPSFEVFDLFLLDVLQSPDTLSELES